MPIHRYLFLVGVCCSVARSQKPVISPGGVVNAATLANNPYDPADNFLPSGTIATIFGSNLAASTQTANTVPLPTQLAGTSVFVFGVAAPLFYVSTTQINFQVPFGSAHAPSVTVSTGAGTSDPYPLGGEAAPGLFTQDASGCGPAAALNVGTDGTLSLNSAQNSVSPGQFIAAYGTGLGAYVYLIPDGTPAPASPLVRSTNGADLAFEFVIYPLTPPFGPELWEGLAPGLIGVDQYNRLVPDAVREGCAVPVLLSSAYGNGRPVTISIRKGGGSCVDPPPAGYGTSPLG